MPSQLTAPKKRGIDPNRLSDKQRMFCEEYVGAANFCGAEAARRAGYASAVAQAGKLLKKPLVQKYLGKLIHDRVNELRLDQGRILKELETIVFRDVIDLCDDEGYINTSDLTKLPPEIRRCIDGLEVKRRELRNGDVEEVIKIKLVPKMPALELAMKHFGMLAPTETINEHHHHINWDDMFQRPAVTQDAAIVDSELAAAHKTNGRTRST